MCLIMWSSECFAFCFLQSKTRLLTCYTVWHLKLWIHCGSQCMLHIWNSMWVLQNACREKGIYIFLYFIYIKYIILLMKTSMWGENLHNRLEKGDDHQVMISVFTNNSIWRDEGIYLYCPRFPLTHSNHINKR